jgi:hypothetical protein
MDSDFEDDFTADETETGSDNLLSDDNLRLPDEASHLVRVHAVQSWLSRRQKETEIEIGESALRFQELQQEAMQDSNRLRRREQQRMAEKINKAERAYQAAQERLEAYGEVEQLLEECLAHTTSSERVLVEYYLTLENLIQQADGDIDMPPSRSSVLQEVLHRIEQVGTPNED